jgi:tetratricopeptide (TPR) repeat protein
MLSEVEPRLRRVLPPSHLAFAALSTEYALLALAHNNLPSALQRANHAVTVADAAMKAGRGGHDYLSSALVVRSGIELQFGRPDDAAADATRALNEVQKFVQPGTLSSDQGRAYFALGRALQAQSKSEEARAAFRAAAENLQSSLGPDHPDSRRARQLAQAPSGR